MLVTGYAECAALFNICINLSGIQGWLRTARETRSPKAGSTGLNVRFLPKAEVANST